MRLAALPLLLAAAACAHVPPPGAPAPLAGSGCHTASASVAFDFEGASASRCVIEGERSFAIVVSPEHAPPINPSPWYAFRYTAAPGADLTIHLRYLEARHRYAPLWQNGAEQRALAIEVSKDRKSATLALPPGQGTVSGQELFTSARYEALLERLAAGPHAERMTLGQSHDGRPIEALRIGRADAPRLVVLLGRAHPPEVTGALAMEAFVEELARRADAGGIDLARTQIVAVPLLNPDGVARGHWRANLGGQDLNRDWGAFTQPETRAVAAWLERLPAGVKPTAMIDFHSTWHNLFYIQADDETSPSQARFLAAWLGGKEAALPGYPFTLERRNANPGSGTSKNWFHATYAIPAYTYEVGDATDRAAIAATARTLARDFLAALPELGDEGPK